MVMSMRILYARGTHSFTQLGDLYGVSEEAARNIVKGMTWLNPPWWAFPGKAPPT